MGGYFREIAEMEPNVLYSDAFAPTGDRKKRCRMNKPNPQGAPEGVQRYVEGEVCL